MIFCLIRLQDCVTNSLFSNFKCGFCVDRPVSVISTPFHVCHWLWQELEWGFDHRNHHNHCQQFSIISPRWALGGRRKWQLLRRTGWSCRCTRTLPEHCDCHLYHPRNHITILVKMILMITTWNSCCWGWSFLPQVTLHSTLSTKTWRPRPWLWSWR